MKKEKGTMRSAKRRMFKLASLVLCIAMLVSMMPVFASGTAGGKTSSSAEALTSAGGAATESSGGGRTEKTVQ